MMGYRIEGLAELLDPRRRAGPRPSPGSGLRSPRSPGSTPGRGRPRQRRPGVGRRGRGGAAAHPRAHAGQPVLSGGRMLVAGDTLFLEGCGRTDLPGQRPRGHVRQPAAAWRRCPTAPWSIPGTGTRSPPPPPWPRSRRSTWCSSRRPRRPGCRSSAAERLRRAARLTPPGRGRASRARMAVSSRSKTRPRAETSSRRMVMTRPLKSPRWIWIMLTYRWRTSFSGASRAARRSRSMVTGSSDDRPAGRCGTDGSRGRTGRRPAGEQLVDRHPRAGPAAAGAAPR